MADDSTPRVDWVLPGDTPAEQQESASVPSAMKLSSDLRGQDSAEEQLDEEIPVGAFSPIEIVSDVSGKDVSGRAKLVDFPAGAFSDGVVLVAASVSRTVVTGPNYKEELAELSSIDQPVILPNSSYLSDLNNLLEGNSDWLFNNSANEEPVASIAAKPAAQDASQTESSYIDELSGLADNSGPNYTSTMYRQTVSVQDSVPLERVQLGSSSPVAPYTSISPSPRCNASGEKSFAGHFSPVSSIKLSGMSTSPPRRHEEAESANLKRPDGNEACEYMGDAPQHFYLLATAYRKGHPSRNTYYFQHNPLYFEDPNLERCGRSKGCLTPACSAVHFLSTIVMSPLLVVHQCPNTCVTALPDCPTCHSFGPEDDMGGCLPLRK